MMSQPSERAIITGAVNPQQLNNTSASASIDMNKFAEALFILQVGDIPTSGTVDGKLQSDDNPSFTSASDIAGKSMTQFGASDDNKQVIFNLKAEELAAGERYARLLVTGSAHANYVSAVAIGLKPRFAPASDDKAATVVQIVT
jgi:hypothetical protein